MLAPDEMEVVTTRRVRCRRWRRAWTGVCGVVDTVGSSGS